MALEGPADLVLAPAVKEIKHWEKRLRVGVISSGLIDHRAPLVLRHRGEVPLVTHQAVGHLLVAIEISIRRRNLDGAAPGPAAEVGSGCRIGDSGTVDLQQVVVEPLYKWGSSGIPQPV